MYGPTGTYLGTCLNTEIRKILPKKGAVANRPTTSLCSEGEAPHAETGTSA